VLPFINAENMRSADQHNGFARPKEQAKSEVKANAVFPVALAIVCK